MNSVQRWTVGVLVVTLIAVFGACKSAPPPQPLPQPTPVPTPVPTPRVQEEVIHKPVTETIVSEEVTEYFWRISRRSTPRGFSKTPSSKPTAGTSRPSTARPWPKT